MTEFSLFFDSLANSFPFLLFFPFLFFLVKDVLSNSKSSLREKLEEIFKLMLVVWCRQCEVNRLVALEPCGNIFHINSQQNLNFPYVFRFSFYFPIYFNLSFQKSEYWK